MGKKSREKRERKAAKATLDSQLWPEDFESLFRQARLIQRSVENFRNVLNRLARFFCVTNARIQRWPCAHLICGLPT
ncbi:hypothetical protein CQ006_05800 [Pseudomonas cedrina]|uniref:Uncharacterized protein n=1 Tax=Pseudomonas cedrina TaxID=651740 RepID=A0A2S9DZK3_PSECE|nr:hypothetical protein CLM72_26180 [Pseudomonas sp. MYb193]PRC08033.1 hypothetical protein CQ006_05800 [Pseudomonas cedrina]